MNANQYRAEAARFEERGEAAEAVARNFNELAKAARRADALRGMNLSFYPIKGGDEYTVSRDEWQATADQFYANAAKELNRAVAADREAAKA